jgi:4'-phosphopantetheinyl transferase
MTGRRVVFAQAALEDAAARFGDDDVHLWLLPYARRHGRMPLLRLLAAYLRTEPGRLVLRETAHGKPLLAVPDAPSRGVKHLPGAPRQVGFNWSHSGDFALVALGAGVEIGVDIERRERNVRALEIARRFFAPEEAEALQGLARADRGREAFFGLWCAKEAVLKAHGEGLSFGLARVVFSPAGDDWRLQRVDPAMGEADAWHLLGLRPRQGYSGALAWRGGPRRISAWRAEGA